MKVFKVLFEIAACIIVMAFAASFYLFKEYASTINDIYFDAKRLKKSLRWVFWQKASFFGCIVFCVLMNLFCWLYSLSEIYLFIYNF